LRGHQGVLCRSSIGGTWIVSARQVDTPRDRSGQAPRAPGIDEVSEAENSGVDRRLEILTLLSVFGSRCPKCGGLLARSRTRGFEQVRKWLSHRRPHRCRRCGWRGWRHPAPDDAEAIKRAEQLLAELQAAFSAASRLSTREPRHRSDADERF